MATVIIGVGFTALLQLLATGTKTNVDSTQKTTALNLAGNIREASLRVPYADLFELEGTYNPAVDARLEPTVGMHGWVQEVVVQYVDPDLLTSAVPDDQETPTARVTVRVMANGKPVYTTSWLAAASR